MKRLLLILVVILISIPIVESHADPGPVIIVEGVHLAQDAFPDIGGIEYVMLDYNDIRFDMALNISSPEDLMNDAGDSLVVQVFPGEPWTELLGPPRMYYKLTPNPFFDPYRTSGWPNEGFVEGSLCLGELDRYAFDLPDTDFVYPGDVIHYYFEAEDDWGGLTRMPSDISEFDNFDDDSAYPADYVMRGLPTLWGANPGDSPSILMIDDNPLQDDDEKWHLALRNLGFLRGEHYDLYVVKEPSLGVGNGIGGHASFFSIEGYQTILYTSGNQAELTLGNGDYEAGDPSNDIMILADWLTLGEKNLLLSGDHLCADLSGHTPGTDFMSYWMSVDYFSDDVQNLVGGLLDLRVAPIPGNSVFYSEMEWPLLGTYPVYRGFDGIETVGAAEPLAEYLDPAGTPGMYSLAAGAIFTEPGSLSQVLTLPYDLATIGSSSMAKWETENTRANLLNDILEHFNEFGGTPDGIVDVTQCSVEGYTAEPVSIFCLPDRGGHGLRNAFTSDGQQVDATITLTVRDAGGFPIPNYPAEDIWISPWPDTDLVIPAGGAAADAPTDAFGVTTFSNPLALGGWSGSSGYIDIFVGKYPLAIPPLPYSFNGGDITGDLDVNLADIAELTSDWSAGYAYRSDFFWDGVLNLSDLILIGYGIDRQWPDIGIPIPVPSPTPPPAAEIGLYFDEAGTHQTFIVNSPNAYTAYLLLKATAPTSVGGAAFKLEYNPFPSDPAFYLINVTVAAGASHIPDNFNYEIGLHNEVQVLPGEPVLLATIQYLILNPAFIDREVSPLSHDDYPGLVYAEGGGRLGYDLTAVPGHFNPTGSATVTIDVTADGQSPPWNLVGTRGFSQSGAGDIVLAGMDPDTYTLSWGAIPQWSSPVPAVVELFVPHEGEITFTGVYVYDPALGTVEIDPLPAGQPFPWVFDGAGGFHLEGVGSQVLEDMEMDTYTLTWGNFENWRTPDPAVQVLELTADGQTIVFSSTYEPMGTVVVSPLPDGILAPWVLEGALGYYLAGVGETTLTEMDLDDYTLTWGEIPYWFAPDPAIQMITLSTVGVTITFTATYHTPVPQEITVTDVPNDQGRHVRIVWEAGEFDFQGSGLNVTGYSLYRRQDAYKGKSYTPPPINSGIPGGPDKVLGWDYLATVPAHGDEGYQYVALTLCDSTEADSCLSTFFMRVMTDDNYVFYDSSIFSGFSIDNLVPGVPKNLLISYNADANILTWDENVDPDISHYRIYRAEWSGGPVPEFPAGTPFAYEAGTSWTEPFDVEEGSAWDWFYFLTAMDFNGNESEPTLASGTATSGINNPALPNAVALHPCYPNPFNPSTTISFDLPEKLSVRLEIYDISGRRVRVLVGGETYGPGRHEMVWNGLSDSRSTTGAGVYFYRLRAGDSEQTRRMTLLK